MTTEIALTNGQNAPAVPTPGTTAAALDMLRGHAEMMSAAKQLATAMVGTQMVPAVYRGKADDAAAAILYGAELGLNPIQSLQQVFPVHGQPSIYSRTMVALLRARGFRFSTVESTDTSVTVKGTSPDGETETSSWTIERARRAGYTSNKKYETDPQGMLYAKACAEVCRKLAPDVLLGISHTREDLELEPAPEPVRVTSERVNLSDLTDKVAPGTPGGVPVKNWEPPAEEKADESSTPVVNDPAPESPESDSELVNDTMHEMADEMLARRGDIGEDGPTEEQVKALGAALKAEGLRTRKAQLDYLTQEFKREITAPTDLTALEAQQITDYLVGAQSADAAKAGE